MLSFEQAPIATQDLPIQAFRNYLHLGSGFQEDDLQDTMLEIYLRSAITTIENKIEIVLFQRNFNYFLTHWHNENRQILPLKPVKSLLAVNFIGQNGGVTPLDIDSFKLEINQFDSAIISVNGLLPTIPQSGQVQINFQAGVSTNWTQIPADLYHAVLMLAAHFYENRSMISNMQPPMPTVVANLIVCYRPLRLSLSSTKEKI